MGQARQVRVEPDKGWADLAACREPGAPSMFPEDSGGVEVAVSFCEATCPVREACLDHAIRNREHWGVWGGASERERRRIIRRRRLQVVAPLP